MTGCIFFYNRFRITINTEEKVWPEKRKRKHGILMSSFMMSIILSNSDTSKAA
jgi:hypothetical protein